MKWFLFCLTECSSTGYLCLAEQQYKEEAHHPDCTLAGGVSVHVGLYWSSFALLQDSFGHTADLVQVGLFIMNAFVLILGLVLFTSFYKMWYTSRLNIHPIAQCNSIL